MWHLDIPSETELRLLAAINAPAVVTIYMPTTPISQDGAAEAMALHNLVKEAMIEVRQRPELPRGEDEYIEVQLLDLIDDDDFWAHQSHGLGVITTPDGQWTFRLPHRPNAQVHVDDKANLIQLIAATAAQDAHVLCLSEGEVRLVDVAADLPPKEVKVAGMPSDAASAAGKSSLKDRSPSGRLVGSEGKRVRIRQFARLVDDALMPILRGDERPLILIATEPDQDRRRGQARARRACRRNRCSTCEYGRRETRTTARHHRPSRYRSSRHHQCGGHADYRTRVRRARHHRRRRRTHAGSGRSGARRGVGPSGGGQWRPGVGTVG